MITPPKWTEGEKDAEMIFSRLAASGIDFLHVIEYHAEGPALRKTIPSLASPARKGRSLPVFANGNLNTPE